MQSISQTTPVTVTHTNAPYQAIRCDLNAPDSLNEIYLSHSASDFAETSHLSKSDPYPLLHKYRKQSREFSAKDFSIVEPKEEEAANLAKSVGSINSLDYATFQTKTDEAFRRSSSAAAAAAAAAASSLRSKLFRPFASSSSSSFPANGGVIVSDINGRKSATLSLINPIFDYEMVDDIHSNELNSPTNFSDSKRPEVVSSEQIFTDVNLFDSEPIFGDASDEQQSRSQFNEDRARKKSNSFNNRTHIYAQPEQHQNHRDHHHRGHPEDPHCHDDSIDRRLRAQTRSAMIKLICGLTLCSLFMIIELVGGYLSSSLAIFADAAHLLSDLGSFCISLLAIFLGQRRPTRSKSFGYYRLEVLGVLVSVASIWLMTAVLLYFAFHRLLIARDFEIDSTAMLIVSSVGLCINLLMVLVLSDAFFAFCRFLRRFLVDRDRRWRRWWWGSKIDPDKFSDSQIVSSSSSSACVESGSTVEHPYNHSHSNHGHGHSHFGNAAAAGAHGHSHMNMNVRAAMLHIIGDIIQSIGVLVAALVIHFWPHLKMADPICTIIFGIIVFATTYRIMNDTVHILMEGFPRGLDHDFVRRLLLERLPETVVHVHSLHIWSLTHGRNVLTVHLAVDRCKMDSIAPADCNFDSIRQCAEKIIRTELAICQSTIQVEYHQEAIVNVCATCIGPSK